MIAEEGASEDTAVVHLHGRLQVPRGHSRRLQTYGTIHCGLETMRHAWKTLTHRWTLNGSPLSAAERVLPPSTRSKGCLKNFPVDLLVVDFGDTKSADTLAEEIISDWIHPAPVDKRPEVILESWKKVAIGWRHGPLSKECRSRWSSLGYTSRYQLINSLDVGGAIDQSRLIVARVRADRDEFWKWPNITSHTTPRPMGNLLTPHGLLDRHTKRLTKTATPGQYPDSLNDPMPDCVGAQVRTPQGVRRIQSDELAKGLGCIGKEVNQAKAISAKHYRLTTSLFIWEALSNTLNYEPTEQIADPGVFTNWGILDDPSLLERKPDPAEAEVPRADTHGFDWRPPDLSPGGEWYQKRLENLTAAASTYGDQAQDLIADGINRMATHRKNYDTDGPAVTRLQILWWEFPPEHWDALRDGSRMGFLSDPPTADHPNSDMDEEQLRVAGQFVDELLEIGAIGPAPDGHKPVCNTPLFCVPKPHQPGEWRVIADCKAGGQNEHIGADPVFLNRPLHILEQMYTGGYTVVADASKFFYQFPVHPDDQKFLGILHPITGEWYVWKGCPMGSGSSPALAGRYGLAFVRMLRERSHWFQGKGSANCYWTELREEGYDPKRGYGFSLLRSDGSPAVKIWVFVDDFALHGPDRRSTTEALKDFLDLAVDVGLLIHPRKLHLPSQVQQYTGFIFDTRSSPVLRIPQDKRERGMAMAKMLREHPDGLPFSRLALSVIAGTLESMADATPNRMGHTYLRSTHALIHPAGQTGGRDIYYTSCTLTTEVRREMDWWIAILSDSRGRGLRSGRSSTLIPTWGDGSGTGTGGTILLPDRPLKLWMGQWSPTVYHFSSNWKELKTLLLTLQQLASDCPESLAGTTVFYFTDNTATYYISASGSSHSTGLHALIEQVQLITLKLRCHLEVIHVPGVVMIGQGTDGLSRGIWLSSLHPEVNQQELTAAVFDPMHPDMELAHDFATRLGNRLPVVYHHWDCPWGSGLFHHLSVWFPPPELARQCLIGILESWMECPRTTGALLFIPRTLARCWLGLSRHIQLVDTIRPDAVRLRYPPRLPIPILVLYLAPHIPVLPSHSRVGTTTKPQGFRWHEGEAARVRGLSPADPTLHLPSDLPLSH